MGTESGQPLEKILLRKELERRAGNGLFAWGIGNSLGETANAVHQKHGMIDVLFSPMKSPAKSIDAEPGLILLWLDYYDVEVGQINLPEHMIITSRGNLTKKGNKRAHYALFCSTNNDITEQSTTEIVDANRARNFASQNQLGASQVTALVRYEAYRADLVEKPYPVTFRATLSRAGFVRLASPVILTGELSVLYIELCNISNPKEWAKCAKYLRKKAEDVRIDFPRQKEIFEFSSLNHESESLEPKSRANNNHRW